MPLRPGFGSASPSGSGSPSGFGSPARKKNYKNIIDTEKGRRRREEDLAGIRKTKREETLLKKRRVIRANQSCDTVLEDIPEDIQHLWSENPDEQLAAAVSLGSLLTLDNPPIDEVIVTGIISRFVEFLSREDSPQLQLEAVWILTNIAGGASDHTAAVVNHGAIPSLVNLLNSTDDNIREQTVGALGNIAGDSPRLRDLILNHGALSPLLRQLQPHSRLSLFREATWCLSNFLRGKPPVNLEQVRPALPVLQQLIHFNDEEVVQNTCWALAYLADGSTNSIQAVIELGVCPKLVDLLHRHPSDKVILPALQALGNIAAGNEVQSQVVIDNRLLPFLHQLLTKEYKKRIFKEVCWTISNITGGSRSQIQAVIDANIIPPLVEILHNSDFEVKRAAAWAIFNVTCKGSEDNIRLLADEGCIKALCELLGSPDPMLLSMCLQGLENILRVGKADKEKGLNRVNIFAERVVDCEGIYDKIYNLLSHGNEDITERAWRLCKRIWPGNDFQDLD